MGKNSCQRWWRRGIFKVSEGGAPRKRFEYAALSRGRPEIAHWHPHTMNSCLNHRPVTLFVPVLLFVLGGGISETKKIDGDLLLQADRLIEIRIELPAADWTELCAQTRNVGAVFSGSQVADPFTYFKADLWIDGVKIESVGIRKKGFIGSLDHQRPSLKISFDEFVPQDPVKGLNRLTLNNNKQDTSQVSQFLTYKLFRDAGVHAPRCNFAHVTVNGQTLGIYSNVESVKKAFLRHSFGDDDGNLYEGTLTDFHPKTVEKLEAKTNSKDNDRTRIARLAELLTADGELPIDDLAEIVDIDNFLRFWAVEGMIRFWDGYTSNQNNYFYYIHPKNERGYFIPWGADSCFSRDGGPFARFNNQSGTAIYAQSILANRLYHCEGMPQRYRETMQRLLDDVWNEQQMIAEIDRIEQLVSSHLHPSQRGTSSAMQQTREFINTRRQSLQSELAKWPASVPTQPRKPMYTVYVGHMSGSFSTTWHEGVRTEPAESGGTQIQLKLDEQSIDIKRWDVTAQTFRMPRFGWGGGRQGAQNSNPPVSLTFSGTPASGGQQLSIALNVERDLFLSSDQTIPVTGRLSEGTGGGGFGFGDGANRSVSGQLRLTDAGTNDGETVAGTIDLEIVEVHGGFFDRRPQAGTPPPRPNFARPVLRFQQAIDIDGDGKLSAGEISNATAALQGLDQNGDGELTINELLTPVAGPPPGRLPSE